MKRSTDLWVEELVTRTTKSAMILQHVLVLAAAILAAGITAALGVIFSLGTLLLPVAIVIPIAFVIVVFRYIGVEYEYSFLDGDVTITRIRGKRKRKTALEFTCGEGVELMAPAPVVESRGEYASAKIKLDARGTGAGTDEWAVVCAIKDGGRAILIFNPTDRMLAAMSTRIPRGKLISN